MRVSIYARQSLDRTGEGAGVSRQLAACRDLCRERGWDVEAEFVDNDRSATSGKARPQFDRLLESAPSGIVVWNIDRLVRLTRDLERVIDLGVNVYAVKAGHLDLSNPAGRAVARTVTAWATYEGEQKAERQIASNRQRAAAGSSGWSRRPFGFRREGGVASIDPDEAAEIKDAAGRVLQGETLTAICDDLNERNVSTSTGKAWTVTTLRRVLLNPRVAGRVTYKGEDMGVQAPEILTPDVADRLRAKLTDPRRKTAPSTQVRHFLSGLVRCGRCDVPMFATNTATRRSGKYSVYRCKSCARVRRRDYVDEVVEGVLIRASKPP